MVSQVDGLFHPPLYTVNFCRMLCRSPCKSLKVLLLSRIFTVNGLVGGRNAWLGLMMPSSLSRVLTPLKLLRKVGKVEFEGVENGIAEDLKALMEPRISIGHVFRMHE